MPNLDPCFLMLGHETGLSEKERKLVLDYIDNVRGRDNADALIEQKIQGLHDLHAAVERAAAKRILAERRMLNHAPTAPNPFKKVMSYLIGDSKGKYAGSLDSTANEAGTVADLHGTRLMVKLQDALGIKSQWHWMRIKADKAFSHLVIKEMAGESTGNSMAKKVSDILSDGWEQSRIMANNAGAYIKRIPGYIGAQYHDRYAIQRFVNKYGEDAWIDRVLPRLDANTFEYENGAIAEPREFVREALHNILYGKEGGPLSTNNGSNIAARLSRHRVLHFKDAQSFIDYDNEFGSHGSIIENNLNQQMRLVSQAVRMERLGTNEQQTVDNVLSRLGKESKSAEYAKKTRVRKSVKYGSSALDKTDRDKIATALSVLRGDSRMPVNPTIHHWAMWAHKFLNLVHLGGATFSAFSDHGNLSGLLAKASAPVTLNAKTLIEGWTHSMGAIATVGNHSPLTNRLGKDLVRALDAGAHGFLHGSGQRFDSAMAGLGSRAVQAFYSAIGLTGHDDWAVLGAQRAMAHLNALWRNKSFDELKGYQDMLKSAGITREMWDKIRATEPIKVGDHSLITPDMVEDEEAGRKYLGFMRLISQMTVPLPDAETEYNLARVFGNAPAGTVAGEIQSMLKMYKYFPTAILTRVLPQIAHGGPFVTAYYMAVMTGMGYVSLAAKAAIAGKYPPDPTDPKTAAESWAQGGGASYVADLLMRDFSFGSATAYAAGPAAGTLDDLFRTYSNIKAGKEKPVQFVKMLRSDLLPFGNMPVTKMAVNYLMVDPLMNAIEPGYLEEQRARYEKQYGVKYYIK